MITQKKALVGTIATAAMMAVCAVGITLAPTNNLITGVAAALGLILLPILMVFFFIALEE